MRIFYHPDPPAGGDVPPTTQQLKALVDAAAAGSAAAQAKLDKYCADHDGLASRVAALEKALPKPPPPEDTPAPEEKPARRGLFIFDVGRRKQK